MNKCTQNIAAAMKKFYNISNMSYDEAINIIRGIESDLIAILPEYQSEDNDYRLGNETYSYGDNESILSNLNYVSDRWRVAFRIAWILGLVNQNYR